MANIWRLDGKLEPALVARIDSMSRSYDGNIGIDFIGNALAADLVRIVLSDREAIQLIKLLALHLASKASV
jgi:hypothetical protein